MSDDSRMEDITGTPDSVSAYSENDTAVFGSAVRLAIVEDIVRDICSMIPVVVVSGEAGDGKTTLCRQVVAEIPADWETITFDTTVESFEDVVRQVAVRIGCGDVDVSRSGMSDTIDIIGNRLVELQRQVVVVLDQAEMIYLATLERIRKMLDQLNEGGVKMQVILCGRPLLLENIKQLSIVNFKEVPEKWYVVAPLSVEDVGTYIDHLAGIPASGVSGAFLPAAIQKIHLITGGNLSKVRDCVLRICNSPDREAALDSMLAGSGRKKGRGSGLADKANDIISKITSLSRRTQLIAGGVAVVLLFSLLFFSGDDESTVVQEVREGQVTTGSGPVTEAPPKAVTLETTPKEKQQEGVATASKIPADALPPQQTREASASSSGTVSVTPTEITNPPGKQVTITPPVEQRGTDTNSQGIAQRSVPATEPYEAAVTPVQAGIEQAVPASAAVNEPKPAEQVDLQEVAPVDEVVAVTQPAAAEKTLTSPQQESSREGQEAEVAQAREPESTDEEIATPEQVSEVPLLRNEQEYKKIIPVVEVGADLREIPESESNIVISSLSETEKREILVITSSPYKIIKDEPVTAEPIAPIVEPVEVNPIEVQPAAIDTTPLAPPVVEKKREQLPVQPVIPRTEPPVDDIISVPKLAEVVVPQVPDVKPEEPEKPVIRSSEQSRGSILERRMEAGYPWLAGRRDGRYTMQLMMLSSYDAEEKITAILSQKAYGRASDNFYIFRKNSSPPVYFVFYGEYANKAAADRARNEIPVFLRNHRPYVLSVASAMKKVKY